MGNDYISDILLSRCKNIENMDKQYGREAAISSLKIGIQNFTMLVNELDIDKSKIMSIIKSLRTPYYDNMYVSTFLNMVENHCICGVTKRKINKYIKSH